MISKEDLTSVTCFSLALWTDPERSERVSAETLAAVATMDVSPDRFVDRTATALLHRAARDGARTAADRVSEPFFRLTYEERFILAAIYRVHWPYERIGKTVGKSAEEVATIAWAARLHLNAIPGSQVPAPHPTGSRLRGGTCPEYHPAHPWTQRFLDDEMEHREKIFIQNHVLSCTACQQALNRCRKMVYSVDGLVPRVDATQDRSTEKRIRRLRQVLVRTNAVHRPWELSPSESLLLFFERREVQWFLALFAFTILVISLRR